MQQYSWHTLFPHDLVLFLFIFLSLVCCSLQEGMHRYLQARSTHLPQVLDLQKLTC